MGSSLIGVGNVTDTGSASASQALSTSSFNAFLVEVILLAE
jgi:hypothetical protein